MYYKCLCIYIYINIFSTAENLENMCMENEVKNWTKENR